MKKSFFGRFAPQERTQNKSLSMHSSDWQVVEAYRLFGSDSAGYEIPLQRMVREILLNHITHDRDFMKTKGKWIDKVLQMDKVTQTITEVTGA